jgi:hypothetical protein
MTRHCHRQVHVQLDILLNAMVDAESIVGFAIEIFAQVVEDEKEDCPADSECNETASDGSGLVRRGNLYDDTATREI